MIELRGIEVSYSKTGKAIRLITRGERGDDYTTIEYPKGKKLTRGQVMKFLASKFGVEPGKIIWPPHIKIPK